MLVITAFQRSGTTAFGEQLGATTDFAYWGEIFHPDGYVAAESATRLRLRARANWFRFAEENLPTELRTGPQDAEARTEAWDIYARALKEMGVGRRPVVDVKYNSWHHLEPVWVPIGARPNLMSLVEAQHGLFVHLVRENVLAQALSEVFAFESGLWHRRHGQAVDLQPLRFEADTEGLLDRMGASRRGTERMRRWLEDLPHVELAYEGLFEETGGLSLSAREALAAHGVDVSAVSKGPVLGRTGQTPRQWVTNLDEVFEALEGTEYEDLLEPTLGAR